MKHEHEGEVTLDELIKCRICGENLPSTEKEIATFSSKTMLKSALEEIAVAGRYTASGFSDSFVIYSKDTENIREEVSGKRKNSRAFVIYKRLSTIQ